ncbi:stalk domain-containing protein [Paenibacillus sp. J2TS4]|uniref:stalk domain-containing protein n=1 Tax=Paenibacillus sp. J2TS4 TaxID=2807194 RepID=UPI001AFDF8E3|nr:stalk domain-containing protein [Paenibacillus sp. J2TS4]GIP36187.1 hypothetical protein J2TS4_53970 [Paenibacillus sp. J2TS4]
MKKMLKSVAIAAVSIGLISTTAIASSADWTEVKALFNNKMKVTINGQAPDSPLTPLMVDGVAYLPVRDMGEALGMNVNWNEQEYRIEIENGQEEAITETITAIILDVKTGNNGDQMVEVLSLGADSPYPVIRLIVPSDLTIKGPESDDSQEKPELKPGMKIEAAYSLAMTRSLPPQTRAESVRIIHELGLVEGIVQSVQSTDHGLSIKMDEQENDPTSGIILHIAEDTVIRSGPLADPATADQIKEGAKIKAYYGPIMTMSLPPQSPAQAIILLDDAAAE